MGEYTQYDMSFIIDQDLKDVPKKKSSKGYDICCPFCEKITTPDKKFKYSIDIYKNVGHCMRCGAGHGVLGLHAALRGLASSEEAKKDLDRRFQGLGSDAKLIISQNKEKIKKERAEMLNPAPIEIRDEVYRKLWEELTLSDAHKMDLIKRGLTDKEIDGNYKTVPVIGFSYLAQKCIDQKTMKYLYENHMGIPGFYNIFNAGRSFVSLDSGYLIRVFDEKRRISGFQIRFDKLPKDAPEEKKEKWAKYKWLTSSGMQEGCSVSGIENIHHAGDWSKVPENVVLTEGVLKSDIASILWGKAKRVNRQMPFLGLVGVNNYNNLENELKDLKTRGLKSVAIAVDMDYREKPQVDACLKKIEGMVSNAGLSMVTLEWNDNMGKGIDDFLLNKLRA